MIHIIITSYDEPKSTIKAIQAILEQDIPQEYKIIVAEPFEDNIWEIEAAFPGNKNIEYYQDEGKGKSNTLNKLLKKYSSKNLNDIIIFTDGDVYLDDKAIKNLASVFEDSEIGIACGHPVSDNPRNTMLGYWSHLLFDEMNYTRIKLAQEKQFFEVTGYLFAMRNGVFNSFESEASEDNVLPLLFWQKGYKIGYAEDAKVHVLNPQHYKDWILQKKRNIKGHIALQRVKIKAPRKNTFLGEAKRGIRLFFSYPRNPKESFWTLTAMFARLHAWVIAYYETKIKKQKYKDGWREEITETTRPLD